MSGALPRRFRYPTATPVAVHRSAPYAQIARLVLKVIESDVARVVEDEAEIANAICEGVR